MKLFGTDGIRGIANKDLTPELAYKIGKAGAHVLSDGQKGKIIIGKDTRVSGDMLEAALVAGITSMGIDVHLLDIIPTPAVAYLAKKYNALAGIVISASHNPGEYNGIKFFNNKGFKLSNEIEREIENKIRNIEVLNHNPIGNDLGKVYDKKDGSNDYKDFLRTTINIDLTDIKVAMDCGNGALYKIGPELIEELNGEVIAINTEPNGMNINANCGSTNPEEVRRLVLEEEADIGLSFDGDGDRIIAVDNKGNIMSGDHILAICGTYLKSKNSLPKDTIVGTIMTNIGLDLYLEENDMSIVKTDVGDKYVLDKMLSSGYALGGEQSGHIIFLDYNTTGDGLATGLHLLEVMQSTEKSLEELNAPMKVYPQTLENAEVKEELKYKYLDNDKIIGEIQKIEGMFQGEGRVVIRPSGTEQLVRIMIEGKDQARIEKVAKDLAILIEREIGN